MKKFLGPVVTSKSIGKSLIQINDLFPMAKRFGYDSIILCESHPKSWPTFINLAKKYKIVPYILFEMKGKIYFPVNSKELLEIIQFYNGKKENINVRYFEKNEIKEKILFPTQTVKELLGSENISGGCLKGNLKIEDYLGSNILKYINSTTPSYNVKDFYVNLPQMGGFKRLYESLLPYMAKLPDEYMQRLKKELLVIKDMEVSDYILTVKKIVETARNTGAYVGPGRGSAVGSLIVYMLGITLIDPIKYNLYFERFLNPSRKELPDIDLDIDSENRDNVIKKLNEIFSIAQVRTYVRMKEKSAVKKAKEILGYDMSQKLKFPIRSLENMKRYPNMDEKLKKFYTLAFYFEGLEIAESVHAAGVILSKEDMGLKIPLDYRQNNIPITLWEMDELKLSGIEKFDILSLDTLALLKRFNFKYAKDKFVNLEDKEVYKLISAGLTEGIFQLESRLGKKLSRKLAPKNFMELTILLAMNRPGPLNSGMFDEYLEGSSREYLKKLLPETKGVIIFQEQVMYIAQKLGGLSPEESDDFRKAMSKKDIEKLKKLKEKFIFNAAKKIGNKESQELYSKIEKFAEYAFNKSHSVAYAHLSYWLAEIKTRERCKFFLEYIKFKGLSETLFEESKYMNIQIKNASILYPQGMCKDNALYLPLRVIKGVGIFAEEVLTKDIKEKGNYKDFEDFIKRTKEKRITRNIIEQMIKGGVFDIFTKNRRQLLRMISEIEHNTSRKAKKILSDVFGENISTDKEVITDKEDIIKFEKEVYGFKIN
ncbi:DNA polymerase III subunit alpha [Marinitoga sp. 1138]|uniref:DNA polymerase III subunit alpha n=1 Tax=Marinitoga sp. 1138 TaxID=1643334 RepID=UPI001586DA23|nr:DNA polymerase III subunit alpha [Marinitoga sp. 1138]NUU97517.1 hypothetical protein [Marinitoga sp. 1138]